MRNYPLLIIVFLAASVLIVVFLVWPRYQQFQTLEIEIEEKKLELESQESYYNELDKTSNELEKYKDVLAVVESALPENHSLPELLNFVQKTASQTGLTVKQVAPFAVASEIDSNINTTRVNINLDGDYEDLKEFLTIIEKSARFIEVNEVTFLFPEEDIFNFSITITVNQY